MSRSRRDTARARSVATPEPAPSTALRAAAAVTAVAGTSTMVVADVVEPSVALLTAVLTVAASAAAAATPSMQQRARRRQIAVVVLGIAALVTAIGSSGQLSVATASALGMLLCTAAVSHSFVIDTVRDARVNLAVSASMLLLATGLAPGLRLAVPVVLTWTAVVVTLVLATRDAEGAAATTRARTASASASGSSLGSLAGAAATAVLLGLALALVLPHPTGLGARAGLADRQQADPDGSTGASRDANAYLGAGRLDLNVRGRLNDSPVAVVTGDQPRLWRANVLESYDGHGWSNAAQPSLVLTESGTEAAIPPDPRSPQQADQATTTDGVGWVLDGSIDATMLTPGIGQRVRMRHTGAVVRDGDGRVAVLTATTTPSYVVDSVAVPPVATVPDSATTSTAVDATDPVWLALPPTVPRRVSDLAREVTAGASTRVDTIRAVEEHVRRTIRYDLDSPITPVGTDTVDDVLFRTRSGFCEHFAAAEVVMLRSLGVPARMVSGFSTGVPDGAGRTILRSSDAHAWVEAWVPGTGWVSSDPTAGSVPAERGGADLAGKLNALSATLTDGTVRKAALAVVLVALAAAVVLLPGRLRRRRTTRAERADRRGSAAPLFAAFHRLEAALAAQGRARGQAESVRALAARLRDTNDVVGALLTVERASYASVPPSRAEVNAATEEIDRATARLLSQDIS